MHLVGYLEGLILLMGKELVVLTHLAFKKFTAFAQSRLQGLKLREV